MTTHTTTLPVTFEASCGAFFEGELQIEYSVCDREPEVESVKQRIGQGEWTAFNGCDADDEIYHACLEDMWARHDDAMQARAEARREEMLLGAM